jgi:Ca2+-transporting ATPase
VAGLLSLPAVERAERLRRLAVLARVTPEHKAQVVEALRRHGEVVAMAGDGVNDAPALKVADVGIAVGRRSSDLARQVADVVLAHEDLSSILQAVGEGRIVQENLRQAVRFLLATNLSEIALVLGAGLLGARDPLTPLQLLWLNLLTDTLPALALALEPGRPDVLAEPPAPPSAPLLSPHAWREVVRHGLWLGAAGLAGHLVLGPGGAFAPLTGAQLSYALLRRAPGSEVSPRFLWLVAGSMGLQAATLVVNPLRRVLALGPLAAGEPLAFAAGLLVPAALAFYRSTGATVVRRGDAYPLRAQPARPPARILAGSPRAARGAAEGERTR